MDTQNNTLTIREYPMVGWGVSGLMVMIGGSTAAEASRNWS